MFWSRSTALIFACGWPGLCERLTRRLEPATMWRPTVWAWRPGRAKKMAAYIDHVLALLPFEPPYMQAEGMACDFVGHPVAAQAALTSKQIAQFQADLA